MNKISWHTKLFSGREKVGFSGSKKGYDFISSINSKFVIFGNYAKSKSFVNRNTYYLYSIETGNLILKSNYELNLFDNKLYNLIGIKTKDKSIKYLFEVLSDSKELDFVIEEEADIEKLKNSRCFYYIGKYLYFQNGLFVSENNIIFMIDENNKKIIL